MKFHLILDRLQWQMLEIAQEEQLLDWAMWQTVRYEANWTLFIFFTSFGPETALMVQLSTFVTYLPRFLLVKLTIALKSFTSLVPKIADLHRAAQRLKYLFQQVLELQHDRNQDLYVEGLEKLDEYLQSCLY